MDDHRTGGGDPAKTLALLWRHHQPTSIAPGPKPKLSTDVVVDAAIALADGGGLGAVTLRRLARDFGVTPMGLYTYVHRGVSLLDLMVDQVFRRAPCSVERARPWPDRVRALAVDHRALVRSHPWLLAVHGHRPVLGPGHMAKYDRELAAFDDAGLTDLEMDAARTFVLGIVESCVRAELGRGTGDPESDAQWWDEVSQPFNTLFDANAYPLAARVGSAAGEAHGSASSPDFAFEFGLARAIDGIAALVETREP